MDVAPPKSEGVAEAELAGVAAAEGAEVLAPPLRGGFEPKGEGLLGAVLRPGKEKLPEAGAGAGALAAGCEDVAAAGDEPKLKGELAGAAAVDAGVEAGAEDAAALLPPKPPNKGGAAAGAEDAGVAL